VTTTASSKPESSLPAKNGRWQTDRSHIRRPDPALILVMGVAVDIEELIERHEADAWDCHSRGRADSAELHMVFTRELEEIAGSIMHWSNGLPVVRVKLLR
jgi:hypothetical protein